MPPPLIFQSSGVLASISGFDGVNPLNYYEINGCNENKVSALCKWEELIESTTFALCMLIAVVSLQ
jgi:hypothetical protein